jgi:hypothetical protein
MEHLIGHLRHLLRGGGISVRNEGKDERRARQGRDIQKDGLKVE